MLAELYTSHSFLLDSQALEAGDKEFFRRISVDMDDVDATMAIHYLSKFLYRYYGNLEVVTTTSDKYATSFGFTEEEVFAALEECALGGEKEEVKHWYDGFIF